MSMVAMPPGIAETMKVAFDARAGDVMYVVADPGWITGQSYMISAPLLTRVTTVLGEGAPVFPHSGRFAAMIERHGVTIFKAGVTFLKAVMTDPQNLKDIQAYDMKGLRVATFCAEPCSPPVQAFGMEHVTPQYINSYWATEHGGIAWTHFYGNGDFPLAADARTFPLPWIVGDVWVEDEAGACRWRRTADATRGRGRAWRRAEVGEKGEIIIAAPYPYLARTVWGDPEHFTVRTAASLPGGRVMAIAGTAITGAAGRGSGPIRRAISPCATPMKAFRCTAVRMTSSTSRATAWAPRKSKARSCVTSSSIPDSPLGNVLVVGAPHREKGLTPIAFVTSAPGQTHARRFPPPVRSRAQEKGAVAVPGDFIEVSQFPETRSGKYMRRMVRALVEGGDVGDVTTLAQPREP
jgi:acrylyl-CoA reductase (NADPH) / 3-hydroxypropionyl-CoA dehydratase / 3-hydroxypropionyl-CoA synthetase